MPPRSLFFTTALLFVDASGAVPAPASAADPHVSCPAMQIPAPEKKKRKGLRLGGLLGAMQRSGVGDVVGGGILGDGKAAQIAGIAGAIASGADPAGAAASAVGHGRTGALVGAAVGTAAELARSAASDCAPQQPAPADTPEEYTPIR